MKNTIIEGAYDLHIHSAPDLLPRKLDDLELAQRIIACGMAGYASKSHFFCTAERAALVHKLYPACRAVGTITLNNSVGGINALAVEMAGRAGAQLVWFPTVDSEHEQKHVLAPGNKKLPFWAQILTSLKQDGINSPVINIVKDGVLIPQACDVLDTIAKYGMILATSHISHEETFALVKAAKERKVERIIITHVDFPSTFYSIDEQKELLKYGAYMEHCFTTWDTGKVDFAETERQIKAIGADHVLLTTDLGQSTNVYPDEGLLAFCNKLVESGFSENEVRRMCVDNPKKLLGLAR
jgi:hypothetical protein